MQSWRDGAQQMASTIQQQNNLHVCNDIGRLIHAFMQIANYKSWLDRGSTNKTLIQCS